MTRVYYRGAAGVVVMYDITKPHSFNHVMDWIRKAKFDCEDSVFILVGGKLDLKDSRKVSYSEAKRYADEMSIPYIEISSKTGENVDKLFHELSRLMAARNDAYLGEPCSVPTKSFFTDSTGDEDDNSDEESFYEDEFEEDISNLVSTKPKERKLNIKRAKHQRTNVNICNLSLADLANSKDLMTGDPIICKYCGVILNSLSKVVTKSPSDLSSKYSKLVRAPPIHQSLEEFSYSKQEGDSYWECEFCLETNIVDIDEEEIPQSSSFDYIAEPAPFSNEDDNYSNVVFCIDTSGSMCVTSKLKNKIELRGFKKRQENRKKILEELGNDFLFEEGNSSFVSRLQCVQSAVDYQINKYTRENPKTKIGLVTFSNDVSIIGDGIQAAKLVYGDRLNDWDELQKIGSEYKIEKSVSESKEQLIDKLWDLEESGATALGPALQLSIAIAGSKPGSKVILCTDGLANIGLGSLEGKESQYTPYYIELAEQAKLKGVSVSIISLIGSECSLENLSVVTEETGGIVTRVDPLQLEGELSTIEDKPILGYTTMAMIVLHRGLKFQNEMDDENENRNWIVKDLGNVREDTKLSFSYGFRSKEECDLTNVNRIPFQVHLLFTKPNGERCLRISTTTIEVTNNREQAEKSANLNIIGTHAAQKAAKLAKDGEYELAQMETRAAQRFMLRNGAYKSTVSAWSNQVNAVDTIARNQRKRDNAPTCLIPDNVVQEDSSVVSVTKQLKAGFNLF